MGSLSQANSIYTQVRIGCKFQLRMVFQTQVPISLVMFVIGIRDLYISNYKYTIKLEMVLVQNKNSYPLDWLTAQETGSIK